jgi:nucleoside-diphosphate-sugar epimerase/predicted dehydrogenase
MKRVGLIGAGYVSQFHLQALRRLPDVQIVGVCDVDRARAAATGCRVFDSPRQLYGAGVDFVHILTPPASHAELTLEALRHGCHVLVEKPLATSVEDCDRIAAAAGDRIVCVCHSLLRDPFVMQALELVRHGAVGELLTVDYFRSSEYPPWSGGALPPQYRDGGYPFRDLGVHALYLMQAFLGPLQEVQGWFGSAGRHSTDPNLRYDEWRALVRAGGGTGQIQLSWNVRPLQHQIWLQGTDGVIRADLFSMFVSCRRSTPWPKPIERVRNAQGEARAIRRQVRRNVVRYLRGRLMPYHGLQTFLADFYAHPRPIVSLAEARQVVDWMERVARPADDAKRRWLAGFTARPTAPVLVTGASGFIGRQLVRRLLEQHDRVRVLVRRDWPADPRVEVVIGDLGDPDAVDRAVAGTRIVYHLGATMRGRREDFDRGTVTGTRHVVEAVRRHRVDKLVYVSSLSVLHAAAARPGVPIREDWPLEPRPAERGAYTQSKLAAEQLVRQATDIRSVIVRPGQVFGPGVSPVSPAVAHRVGRRWVILGNGRRVLPLVHVDDVVEAILLAAQRDRGLWHIVDSSARVTHAELVPTAVKIPYPLVWCLAWVAEVLGRLLRRPPPLSRYRLQSALAPVSFDCRAAERDLGWTPRVGVAAGLKQWREASA